MQNNADNKNVENINGAENSVRELEPMNEFERLLIQLLGNEIPSEEFLGALFNGPLFVLTSEDQIDKKKNRLKDNPSLFTLFGNEKQPYLALFTDKSRALPIQEKDDKFNVLLQVPVGDLLSGSHDVGVVVNPFWDKHARWEPQQIGAFKNIVRREESGLWVKIPDDQLITVYTENGQPLKVEREQFRSEMLPQQLKNVMDKPEQLYNTIISAVNDGFHADVLDAAKKLYETDTVKERATTGYGVVLMQNGQLDEAEELFNNFLKEVKSPVIMTNLAKLNDIRGNKEARYTLLEDALNINPNMDSALEWYCSIINEEKGGQPAIEAALDELEGLAGSWRPAMLLGRAKIMDGKVDEALEHYTDALEVEGHSPDALVTVTSELGRMGHHAKVISFGLEHYNMQRDDPRAAFNIFQACLHEKNAEPGLQLCEKMKEIPVPDLQNAVAQFKAELEKI